MSQPSKLLQYLMDTFDLFETIRAANYDEEINERILGLQDSTVLLYIWYTQCSLLDEMPEIMSEIANRCCNPQFISDELAEFLGKEKGCKISVPTGISGIHAYIRANNLDDDLDDNDERIIRPDAKLAELLKNGEEELNYGNLASYIKAHYIWDRM